MQSQIEVVCKCPECRRTYRQTVTSHWAGAKWRPRRYETALLALTERAGQRDARGLWAGLAYCSGCSLRRCPPALRDALSAWLTKGEYL